MSTPAGASFHLVHRFLATSRSTLSRWLLVLALALTTPSLQDALTDLSGVECCDDDCDDGGTPCSQDCAHCPCAGFRSVTVPAPTVVVMRPGLATRIAEALGTQPANGALDPPFRPPAS
jgi:hypothetical protein